MPSPHLNEEKCVPCSGNQPPLDQAAAEELLRHLAGWTFLSNHKAIQKSWRMKDFASAVRFIQEIARVADADDHHPDLHLTGYRNLSIQLSTHAIGGLSRNDFILAAKIDELPKDLKG